MQLTQRSESVHGGMWPGALTILDIDIRSIPFEDAAVIVAYGLYTEQEPTIVANLILFSLSGALQ